MSSEALQESVQHEIVDDRVFSDDGDAVVALDDCNMFDSSRVLNVNTDTFNGFNVEDVLTSATESSSGKVMTENAPSLMDYEDDSDHDDVETSSDTNRSLINKSVLNQNEDVMEPEELQCLSLIVHKWARDECGSVKVLHKWKLDVRQIEEILLFARSNSKYSHLFNNLSA